MTWRNAATQRQDVSQFLRDCLQQAEAEARATYLDGTTARAFADLNIAARRLGQEFMITFFPTWYLKRWATKYYEGRPGYSYWWS